MKDDKFDYGSKLDEKDFEQKTAKVTKISEEVLDDVQKENEETDKEENNSLSSVHPKMLNKDSILTIVATLVLALLIIGVAYLRTKKTIDDNNKVIEHNYAVNTTTTESSEEDETTKDYGKNNDLMDRYLKGTTVDEPYPDDYWEVQNESGKANEDEEHLTQLYFNITNDKYYNHHLLDIDTLAIDGNLVDFPNTYEYLKKMFGEFTFDYQTYGENFNENSIVEDEVEVTVEGKTGIGEIVLTFSCEGTPKALKDCKCSEVQLTSFNYYSDKKNMTIALPGNVKFGDNYETITNNFPFIGELISSTDNSFTIEYSTSQGYKVYLIGDMGGLTQVIIKYK